MGLYYSLSRKNTPKIEFVEAKIGTITQEVEATGKIKSSQNTDLAFEKSGKVVYSGVKVNDRVKAGQILMRLNNTELAAQYAQAQASEKSAKAILLQYESAFETQEAKLEELKKGEKKEQIEISQSKLASAKLILKNYYDETPTKLQNVYNLADEAVRVKTSSLFTGAKTTRYALNYTTCDYQAQTDAESMRMISENELEKWNSELVSLSNSGSEQLEKAFDEATIHLGIIQKFLSRVNDTLIVGCVLHDTSLDTYRTNITTARSNIITSQNTMNTQKQNISNQKAAIQISQNQLLLDLAPPTPEQIAGQEGVVKQAKANIESQKAQIEYALANARNIGSQMAKNILVSPINGIVTKVEPNPGEIIAANMLAVSIISDAQFHIEVNIPEADIAKIKIGDMGKITLDAYGEDMFFQARIIAIDPAETIVEGVPTYKATLQFNKNDARIKSGMTANVTIETNKKENVIIVPQRAIITKNGDKFLRIINFESAEKNDAEFKEVKIITGLRGSDGNVEIIEGVKEGDRVITFFEEK